VLKVHYLQQYKYGVRALILSETDVFAGFIKNIAKHAYSFLCVFSLSFCLKLYDLRYRLLLYAVFVLILRGKAQNTCLFAPNRYL